MAVVIHPVVGRGPPGERVHSPRVGRPVETTNVVNVYAEQSVSPVYTLFDFVLDPSPVGCVAPDQNGSNGGSVQRIADEGSDGRVARLCRFPE